MNLSNCTNLSPSIVRDIALDLPLTDVNNLCKTSKTCNNIVCKSENYWYLRYIQDFSFVGDKPDQYNYKSYYMYNYFIDELLSYSGNELQQILEQLIIDDINENITAYNHFKLSLLERAYLYLDEPIYYINQLKPIRPQYKMVVDLHPILSLSGEEFDQLLKIGDNPVIIHNLTGNIRIFKSGEWINATNREDSIYKDILKTYKELNSIESFYGQYINNKFSIAIDDMKPKKCQAIEESVLLELINVFEDINIPNDLMHEDLCYIIKHILLLINSVWFF